MVYVGFKVAGVDSEKLDKAIMKPWASDGSNFSDRIWTKKSQMVDALHGETIRSMLTGGNLKDSIKIMEKYVRNDVKNAKYSAARLIRTESAYFASEGQKECFKDLDVERYEIVATLDNRTSDICQGMDGKVFKMSEFETGVTAPPFHVNCRSTTAPYFDDEFAKGERAARNAEGKTYYVPSDMTYREWKGKQENVSNNETINQNDKKLSKKTSAKTLEINEKNDIIANRHIQNTIIETDNSLIAFNHNDVLLEWAQKVKPEDGYFDVIIHGNNEFVGFDYRSQNMTPEELAKKILNCKGLGNKKIRLLSCETGLEDSEVKECFARKLSRILKREVKAPNHVLYFDENGVISLRKGKRFIVYG